MKREQVLEIKNAVFPTWLDSKNKLYCRMANEVLGFNSNMCMNCPLWTGDCASVHCMYYGISMNEYVESSGIKKFVDGMIAVGLTDEFPCFVDEKSNIFAGMLKPKNWTVEDYIKLEEAYQFAAKAHKGQKRKGSTIPYIIHPVEVSVIAYTLIIENEKKDLDVVVAAILHDVVEDTKYTVDDILNRFGERVARLVDSVSENKREGVSKEDTWKIRKEETIQRVRSACIETKVIALADKLSNLRATASGCKKSGEEFWNRFNQKDKKQHEWYYRSIAEVTVELKETNIYKEYLQLCDDVFGKIVI